jgi:Bacterial aa3 type cytochrome c oxidase subunit IV
MATTEEHYTPGSMDISDHRRAYAGFLTFLKYSLAGILLVMIFLAMFRTHG